MREFALIKKYFDRGPARHARLGIGDDCALLDLPANQTLAVSTDMLVEGRHFFADARPFGLGHKALAVNLSDLAAMGAKPLSFTLGLALPRVDEAWLSEFSKGLFTLADAFGCELIGGDTTQGPLNISISVIGTLPKSVALRRDGAQPGDDVWVSGLIGGPYYAVRERYVAMAKSSAAATSSGLAPFPAHVPKAAIFKLHQPQPRIALGLALHHLASSAIDISDGIFGEVGHLCERSRCGARIRVDQIPIMDELLHLPISERNELGLVGGDEYELCFTAAPENRASIRHLAQALHLPLTVIGEMTVGQGVELVDEEDRPVVLSEKPHEHFTS